MSMENLLDEQTWYGRGSWATDPRYSLEDKLRRWQFDAMMRQRKISWSELCEELGDISKPRLGQLLIAMTSSDKITFRLEDAVDAITQRRHASLCTCEDWSGCGVYTAMYGTDDLMVEAKKGALGLWREELVSTESTPTASLAG